MDYETIIVEKKEGIGKITLNRPEKLNAINMQMLDDLDRALTELEQDEKVQVIIVTGAGRSFCVGRDLKEIGTTMHRTGISVWGRFETISKPAIAAVNGFCYAGALSMVLCFDLVVASENALFGDTHARYGIIHGGGATQRLMNIVGTMKAKEMLFTCEPISAAEAEHLGLVNKVVPPDKLDEAAEELARKIIKNSQDTIRAAKYVMNQGIKWGVGVGLEMELHEYLKHREMHTADIKEKTDSFFKKK